MHAILHRASALLLPCQCVSCRQFSETTGLCVDCWSELSPVTSPFANIAACHWPNSWMTASVPAAGLRHLR